MSKIFTFCFTIWLMATAAFGQCLSIPVPLEKRASAAEMIVLGSLVSQQSYWDDRQRNIYTLNIIEVAAYLKGSGPHQVGIITLGGFIGGKGQITYPSLQISAYNEYVFFLNPANPAIENVAELISRPGLPQMQPYADAQGALTKQADTFHDLYSEPPSKEPQLFQRIGSLTGQAPVTPDGQAFQARNGATGYFTQPLLPITNITPNPTRAGTIDVSDFVTISGSGFGSESTVFYANADDGGATLTGSGVTSDNVSWSSTQVVNKPFSNGGTGTVSVNGQTSSITIDYAHVDINSNFSGFGETTRQRYRLLDINGTGGLDFIYNTAFSNDTAAVTVFERALETWRCVSLVNYSVDTSATTGVSAAANDNVNVVTYDGGLPNGVLGRTTSYFSGSANGGCSQFNTVWWVEEIDVVIHPDPPVPGFNWNFGPGPTAANQYDMETLVLHELGHAHGLGHRIDPGTLMHFSLSNQQDTRTPHPMETAGVVAKRNYSTAALCLTPAGVNGPMLALTPGNCSLVVTDTDLAVTKTVSDGTPEEGDILTYTITIANNGPGQATSVSLVDMLPNGVTRTAAAPNASQGSFNDGNGAWTVGTIANGGNATLGLQVRVDAGASSLPQPIVNSTSNLSLDQTDTNGGNNSDSASISVSDNSDLQVTKIVSDGTPDEGDTLTYTITITNNGPARTTNVSLVDVLPNGVTRTATPPNASQGSFNDGNGLWNVGTLNSGANASLGLEVDVDAGASSLAQPIVNTTTSLNLDQSDTNGANNSGSANITVSDDTDLAVVKTVDQANPCPGEVITYQIMISNNGPARATTVSLADQLPSGVTRTATAPMASQGSFNDGNGIWSVGTLERGNSAVLGLEVSVDMGATGTITNVTSALNLDQTDTIAGNNTASVALNVAAGIEITTQPENATACQGAQVTFEVAASGGSLLWQWFKDGNPIPGENARFLTFVVSSSADEGNYYCEIENDCDSTSSNSASLTVDEGTLSLNIDPPLDIRGLDPVVLNGSSECVLTRAALVWTNLTTLETFTENPLVLENLLETTTFELSGTAEGGGATALATVLVAGNPVFYDYNNDGCNNLLDLLDLVPEWNEAFAGDPNGDGTIDVRDFLYLNLDDPGPLSLMPLLPAGPVGCFYNMK